MMKTTEASGTGTRHERGYIRIRNYQIHYLMAGSGSHAIFLLHETPLSGFTFVPSLCRLSEHFRVIAVDTPGYGNSTPPIVPLSLEEYAQILSETVLAFGFSRVALAGVHTGAALCLEILRLTAAEIIVGVVLSGVPLMAPALRTSLRELVAARANRADPETILKAWYERAIRWKSAPLDLLIRAFADELHVFDRRDWALSAVLNYDPNPALASCKHPVLLLNGRHDSLIDSDQAVAAEFPHIKLTILEGCEGQLAWSHAESYCRHVSEFLAPLFRESNEPTN